MFIFKINNALFIYRIKFILKLCFVLFDSNMNEINNHSILNQIILVGPKSLGLLIITACFIGIVFTLQVVKEFLYLKASSIVGAIISLAFIRELSPILTAIILTGRISSAFTAELATMQVSEQIDALYLLRVNPLKYLVLPRFFACFLMCPLLNLAFLCTSLASSLFICFVFYSIHPSCFLFSISTALSYVDLIKSSFKSLVFSFIISLISCSWGLTTERGAKNVGQSITSSIVTILMTIFFLDCLLTYLLFNQTGSILRSF